MRGECAASARMRGCAVNAPMRGQCADARSMRGCAVNARTRGECAAARSMRGCAVNARLRDQCADARSMRECAVNARMRGCGDKREPHSPGLWALDPAEGNAETPPLGNSTLDRKKSVRQYRGGSVCEKGSQGNAEGGINSHRTGTA